MLKLKVFYFLCNLLFANITILLCFFFLFPVVFKSFFTIPAEIENARLKLALTFPTGAPITVVNDAIEMPLVVINKTIMTYENTRIRQNIY